MPRHEDYRGIWEYKGKYYRVNLEVLHVKNPSTRKWEHYVMYTEDDITITRRTYARLEIEFRERFRKIKELSETPKFRF